MQGRRGTLRRLAAAAIVTGLALVVVASVAGADEGTGDAVAQTDVVAEATANLNGAHVGATNPGFATEGCPAPANTTSFPGTWAWHFVLPGSSSDFVTLTVVFDAPDHTDVSGGVDSNPADNLTITGGVGVAFVSFPNAKHAYVYTPGPDYMLLSGTATVTGDESSFNLSHVCPGTTTTTTEPTPVTFVVPTTTTTVAPTTTTTQVSPTTVTNVTTTTVGVVPSTPGPTAGAAQASQGLPKTGGGMSLPLLFAGIGLVLGGGILLVAARRTAGSNL